MHDPTIMQNYDNKLNLQKEKYIFSLHFTQTLIILHESGLNGLRHFVSLLLHCIGAQLGCYTHTGDLGLHLRFCYISDGIH